MRNWNNNLQFMGNLFTRKSHELLHLKDCFTISDRLICHEWWILLLQIALLWLENFYAQKNCCILSTVMQSQTIHKVNF